MTILIFQDKGVNVWAQRYGDRYEVFWPTPKGHGANPDFTVEQDARRYAEGVAKAIKSIRDAAHGVALRENAARGARVIDLVLRDAHGGAWVCVGLDRYELADTVQAEPRYADRFARSRVNIERNYGPLTVEHSMEVRP